MLQFLASATLFAAALFDFPYAFYDFLRIFICGISCYMCYICIYGEDKDFWAWTFGAIALLFNPFIKIHLDRATWKTIDVIVGAFFFIVAILFKNKTYKEMIYQAIKLISFMVLFLLTCLPIIFFLNYEDKIKVSGFIRFPIYILFVGIALKIQFWWAEILENCKWFNKALKRFDNGK